MADIDVDGTPDELADAYGRLRTRCLELGRSLSDEQAATTSPCCPAWSVKDLYAHFAGVASDILSGNTEGAATEAWADAQVEGRRQNSLGEILDEWETNGSEVEDIVRAVGGRFPPQFFIDCWSHEWDVRQALAIGAVPDLELAASVRPFLTRRVREQASQLAPSPDRKAIELIVHGVETSWSEIVGDGEPVSGIEMSLFEFARLTMGRRSAAQIRAQHPGADPAQLVLWSVNEHDIVDPVLSA